jgi:hypothetical protein
MRTRLILVLAVVEVLLFGLYAHSLSPSPSTCAEANDGSHVEIMGFVEERSKNSFVLNDGTGRVVVLGASFEKGYPVVVEGRVFERGGTKFLECEKAGLQSETTSADLISIAENPDRFIGRIIEVGGKVGRVSSNWFTLVSGGHEIIVLSDAKESGSVLVTGSFFYDPSDLRYKMRAMEVRSPAP